ncbi:hypothetical protein X797_011012 [Metarhizium robertsii]|uniref:Uncharacterized protein n=1 Tax=Metarhizium robertsii TaxID=568076 RepID=A0A014MX05_9HYPO|nr:hypothetical protein X797_011012 [Metarhizium robertsii]
MFHFVTRICSSKILYVTVSLMPIAFPLVPRPLCSDDPTDPRTSEQCNAAQLFVEADPRRYSETPSWTMYQ